MSTERRLDQLFCEWQRLYAQGQTVSAEALCGEFEREPPAELIAALGERIRVFLAAKERLSVTRAGGSVTDHDAPTLARPDLPRAPGATSRFTEDVMFSVAHYNPVALHQEGGLGEIWQGHDHSLCRRVAIKIPKRSDAECATTRKQFEIEGEVTARLDHPGVVPVYGFGFGSDGRPFYAMRFIEHGVTLATRIERFHAGWKDPAPQRRRRPQFDRQNAQFRALLEAFVVACNTVAYAHTRGIVHRDIKPDNIMLDKYDATLVVDWGLALGVERDARAKASGEQTLRLSTVDTEIEYLSGVVGTPSYMSPEQARGEWVYPSADIYSLGATLYQLLTGQKPFQGASILEKTLEGHFPRPREVNPHVPEDLECICLKAMAREPAERYDSADELAQDVKRWLADEPVSVCRETLRDKLLRWSRRHRNLSVSVASAVLLSLLVIAVSAMVLIAEVKSERRAHREAELARRNAEEARQVAEDAEGVAEEARQQAVLERGAAEQARKNALRLSALFAAKSLATEIDLRWRILEAESYDSQLASALVSLNSDPPREAVRDDLLAWLIKRHQQYQDSANATSWFVTDVRGTIVARSPVDERFDDLINKSFSYRDYYHGEGKDYAPGDNTPRKPITNVHRSVVFRSKVTNSPMVAFSVPVWSAKPGVRRDVVGVLAMTVHVGEFNILTGLNELEQVQEVLLVDTREDATGQAGRVLQQPSFAPGPAGRAPRASDRLSAPLLEALRQTRDRRLDRQSGVAPLLSSRDDPTTGADSESQLPVAVEPVLMHGRADEIRDTGWVVMVRQRGR